MAHDDRTATSIMNRTGEYAGLRRGEITALHREDVDLATGVICVERGWDHVEGEIAPKSRQGRRKVPIPAVLRDHLDAYLPDAPASGRIFTNVPRGGAPDVTWVPPRLRVADDRHGLNVQARSTFMGGHANIRITLDQYGHMLPGAEDEAPGLLDAFLGRRLGGAADSPTATHPADSPV